MDRKLLGIYSMKFLILFIFVNVTAIPCGDPPQPDNGNTTRVRARPYYRRQFCHEGYSVACDTGFYMPIVTFEQRVKNFTICIRDLDGLLLGLNHLLFVANNSEAKTNVSVLIGCNSTSGNWSQSILCLPDAGMSTTLYDFGKLENNADSDRSDGIMSNLAMVAAIASVTGGVVLVPLLIFLLKPLCKTEVGPEPDW